MATVFRAYGFAHSGLLAAEDTRVMLSVVSERVGVDPRTLLRLDFAIDPHVIGVGYQLSATVLVTRIGCPPSGVDP